MRLVRLAAAALLAAGTARAADANGYYSVRQLEMGRPCSSLSAPGAWSEADVAMLSIWINGYRSALSRVTPDTWDIVSDDAKMFPWISSYCAANPTHEVYRAIEFAFDQAFETRVRVKPKNE